MTASSERSGIKSSRASTTAKQSKNFSRCETSPSNARSTIAGGSRRPRDHVRTSRVPARQPPLQLQEAAEAQVQATWQRGIAFVQGFRQTNSMLWLWGEGVPQRRPQGLSRTRSRVRKMWKNRTLQGSVQARQLVFRQLVFPAARRSITQTLNSFID